MNETEIKKELDNHSLWIDTDEAEGSACVFFEANLQCVDFSGLTLQFASITESDLTNASFTDSDLYGVDFSETNLTGADFTNSDLRNVDLIGAVVDGANFTDAMVRGATVSKGVRVMGNMLITKVFECEVGDAILEWRIITSELEWAMYV